MADPDNTVLENARKRARRRLVGAVVLALATAVILPMFLESEPRPLGPDVQIQIPAIDDAKFQNRLTPAGTAAASAAGKSAAAVSPEPAKPAADAPQAALAKAVPADAAARKSEPATPAMAPVQKPDANKSATATAIPVAKPVESAVAAAAGTDAQTAAKQSGKPAAPPAATAAAPARKAVTPAPASAAAGAAGQANGAPAGQAAAPAAQAPAASLPAFSLTATVTAPAPDTRAAPAAPPTPASAASPGQYVVQIGAFLDATVAKDLAAKAGEQGFNAYLEAVTTKSGQVQRVRIGPFATRGEADAAAAKLKGAGFAADARPRQDAPPR